MSQLYFAFGSNMSSVTLRERGVRAETVGPALLGDHRLAFTLPSVRWTGRAADVLPAEGHEVWGVLWALSDSNALDPFERRYNRVEYDVCEHAGEEPVVTRRVFAYTVKPELRATDEGQPAPAYLARMIEGAAEAGLPAGYVDFLRSYGAA